MERLKRLFPFFANRDTATAIATIDFVAGIRAALDHAEPSVIPAAVPHAVDSSSSGKQFLMQASARLRVAASQAMGSNGNCVIAIALAQPHYLFVSSCDWPKRDKATKSLTCNVFGVTGESDKLRLHQKFTFLFAKAQDVCRVAGHFLLGSARVIVSQRVWF